MTANSSGGRLRAASFVESIEPVYALVGTLIEEHGPEGNRAYRLLFSDRRTQPLDEQLVSVLEWFRTTRTESQVRKWLAHTPGASAGLLQVLVRNGVIARVSATKAWQAAKSLRGMRLVPTSYLDLDTPVTDGLVAVKRTPESRRDTVVTSELAEVLGGDRSGRDVPAAITTLAKWLGVKRVVVAQFVLTDVPMLIDYGFVRLEPAYLRLSTLAILSLNQLTNQQNGSKK